MHCTVRFVSSPILVVSRSPQVIGRQAARDGEPGIADTSDRWRSKDEGEQRFYHISGQVQQLMYPSSHSLTFAIRVGGVACGQSGTSGCVQFQVPRAGSGARGGAITFLILSSLPTYCVHTAIHFWAAVCGFC